MFNTKRISMIALILLAIGIVGSLLTLNTRSDASVLDEEVNVSEEFTQIDIAADNAQVNIQPSDEQTATVKFFGNVVNESQYDYRAEVEGDTLFISMKERRLWFQFINFDFTIPNASLTIYLPEQLYESVQIETANGRIQVDELQANEIDVKTSNGQILLENVESSATAASTSNGKIILENVKGELFARTSNGEINMVTEDLHRPIDFKTSNGRIVIQTENQPTNVMFDVQTDNGSISMFGDSNWDAIIGDGDHLIKLRTNNGSITVE